MSERVTDPQEIVSTELVEGVGRITVLEALAQDIDPDDIGVSRSNQSTQRPADYDDQ
jgi:hypothetical protein